MRRLVPLLLLACGRSLIYEPSTTPQPPPPPPPDACALSVTPMSLDFGSIAAGLPLEKTLLVTNGGRVACRLKGIALSATDQGFSRVAPALADDTVMPGEAVRMGVRFLATQAVAPFDRTTTLSFATDDPKQPNVRVKLSAHLQHCELTAEPKLVFGPLRAGQTEERGAVITNTGDAACFLASAIREGDGSFKLTSMSLPVVLPGDRAELRVSFTAPSALPAKRTGTLRVGTAEQEVEVALEGSSLFCALRASPNPFDFGNVALNTTATATLSLFNDGSDVCVLSGFFLMADPLFSMPVPPGTVTVQPGNVGQVIIRFTAFDSAPPHQRTGALRFSSNDPSQPNVTLPLSAFINTVCTTAGQFIYTVDRTGTFSRFDPMALTSTPIGTLSCMSTTSPFSMNLDQSATAWVVFDDGKLFKVDVSNAACTPTSFVPGQNGFTGFGMGSVFDSSTGKDTLFIAGGQNERTFGTLDLTSLTTSLISTNIEARRAELAGTGDGQLWAFTPSSESPTGSPVMSRLNPADGGTLESHDLVAVNSTGGYAIKFFGGAFYIFIGGDVWRVPRNTLLPNQNAPTTPPVRVFSQPNLEVVGAGVSTCAPVMGP